MAQEITTEIRSINKILTHGGVHLPIDIEITETDPETIGEEGTDGNKRATINIKKKTSFKISTTYAGSKIDLIDPEIEIFASQETITASTGATKGVLISKYKDYPREIGIARITKYADNDIELALYGLVKDHYYSVIITHNDGRSFYQGSLHFKTIEK